MAQTRTQNNGETVTKYASGFISGTYTAADITLTLGFTPRKFKITNLTDRLTHEWFEGMNQGDYLETVAAGTRTLETDDSIVVSSEISGNTSGGAGTLGTGSGSGARTIGDNTSTQQPGTKGAATVFIDVSVGNIITDNDQVMWEAWG